MDPTLRVPILAGATFGKEITFRAFYLSHMAPRMLVFVWMVLINGLTFSQTFRPYGPGEWRLKLGLPYANNFLLRPVDEGLRSRTGWVGLEVGVEHQRSARSFLALEGSLNGAAGALGLMHTEGEFERYISGSLSFSNNVLLGRVSLGLGISVARNTWSYTRTFVADSTPSSRPLVDRRTTDLGLIFNGYCRIGRAFHAGLIYRPYIFTFDVRDPWQYQHVISIDLMWRIRLCGKSQSQ